MKPTYYIVKEVGSVANYHYVKSISNPTSSAEGIEDALSFDKRSEAEKAIQDLEPGYYFVLEVFQKK